MMFPAVAVHPGEILLEEYMRPLDLGATALARRLGVPRSRIEDITREKRGVTADTAARLAKLFGTTPHFWMNLQAAHDLAKVDGGALAAIKPLTVAAE